MAEFPRSKIQNCDTFPRIQRRILRRECLGNCEINLEINGYRSNFWLLFERYYHRVIRESKEIFISRLKEKLEEENSKKLQRWLYIYIHIQIFNFIRQLLKKRETLLKTLFKNDFSFYFQIFVTDGTLRPAVRQFDREIRSFLHRNNW